MGSSTSSSFSEYLKTSIFGSLDGLRALAILAVLWHHTPSAIAGWTITTRGFLGVDLFFIISGFLITTLLLRELRRDGRISLRNFYIRRFLRIFPAYYLMLLIVGATAILAPGNSANVIRHDLFFAALYLSNLVPMNSMLAITWSLSTEEQFYLVAPWVIKSVRRALLPLLTVTYILVSIPPFRYFSSITLPPIFMETTYGPILLGVILARVLDSERCFSWFYRVAGRSGFQLLALAVLLALLDHPNADISGWHRLLLHWAMLALVASCVIRESNALRWFLTLKPVQRIGRVSYGIYLYHLIVAHFVSKAIAAANIGWSHAAFIGVVVATWAAAELSYRYYESPFLALKTRFGSAPGTLATR
jgi:peptidoglycan/LPS O-acetylase OafA/YrhL